MAERGSLHSHHDLHHAGHVFGPDKAHKGHFTIENYGDHVAIKTCHNEYIAISEGGQIYLTPSYVHDTKMHLEPHAEHHGKFALRSTHQRYLGIHGGDVKVSHQFSNHELFEELAV